MDYQSKFLKVTVHQPSNSPALRAFCVGFEQGLWRGEDFIKHLIKNHLVSFVLPPEEAENVNASNAGSYLARAAQSIYTSEKPEKRGEIGELILYSIMLEHFNAVPLISKFYYKTHSNDTVKGFDSVHVTLTGDGSVNLWLGEVKFYKSIDGAIKDVVSELNDHFQAKYLRSEFMWIENKINDGNEYKRKLEAMLDRANSLDDIINSIHVPVFLTYESKLYANATKSTAEFKEQVEAEIRGIYDKFTGKDIPDLNIHLILLPLQDKSVLVSNFDYKLKALQELF
ncbi:DUF1837 domain-containing protein [Vibrio vulnificus]|uniref:HamA C-terminal domain-containing protein n=1 Tax=Vibrio vulnificus TaxID=672 RepID=UPI001A20DF08|nr:DUF1837 domain-containing protein [Vibrio cholerae]HAS8097917.1 DUF1837 domain-containing protein [Vibrio vulnificus]